MVKMSLPAAVVLSTPSELHEGGTIARMTDHAPDLPLAEVEEDLIYAIGGVAVVASRMELIAGTLYCELLGGGQLAELVTIGQNWATVFQSCRAILQCLAPTEVVSQLKSVFDRADRAYEQRSRIVHGFWVANVSKEGHRFSVLPKRYGKRDAHAWTLNDLVAVRQELASVGTEMIRLRAALPPPAERRLADTETT